ncbi:MAG: PHP domain-containing protein, partial [Salinarchaeum sp.]
MSVRIDSPYGEDGEWFRGNLHTHTDASPDGAWSLETVVAVYADRGYDFVAVTDHDNATPVETVDDVTLLPGIEVTANGTHVVCLGTDNVVSPHADHQRVLDEAAAAGGIGILPRPNWG